MVFVSLMAEYLLMQAVFSDTVSKASILYMHLSVSSRYKYPLGIKGKEIALITLLYDL